MMEIALQEGNPLWPVMTRLASSIEKSFASEDKVSRVHVTPSSGGEQDDDDNDRRSNVDEDKTLGEGREGARIQTVDNPDDD